MSTEVQPRPDLTSAYRALRERVSALVAEASQEQLQTTAPATPEWRVHDVIAHMVGVPADVLAGRMEGVTTDVWTAAQVDARRDLPTAALIDEWTTNAATFEPMLPDFGVMAGQAILDACTHEHDVRDALGAPGARDSDAVHIGSGWLADRIGDFNAAAGHGPVRIETDLWSETYGDGDPVATLRVSAFELMRGSTGRRSQRQLDTWDWSGMARRELVVMPIFVPRTEDFDG